MDQSKPPPGWEFTRGGHVQREGGGPTTNLLQAWNIWLTSELEAANDRIASLEADLDAALDQAAM